MIGSAQCQLGRLIESRDNFEAALALYDPVRDRTSAIVYAIDSRVMCLSWLSHLYALLGHPEEALARAEAASAHARELAHPNTVAVCLAWGCIFHQLVRDRELVRRQAETLVALATEQGFPLYLAAGRVIRGWALADGGEEQDGISEIRRGLEDYWTTGAEMWSPYFLGLLAEACGRAGLAEDGLSQAVEALNRLNSTGARWIESELHRIKGELLLLAGLPQQQAEACFQEALDVACEQQAKLWQIYSKSSLARLCRDNKPCL